MAELSDKNGPQAGVGASPSIAEVVAESLADVAYVSDPQTHEVVWINPMGMRLLGITSVEGRKCHELFQDFDEPCPFCPVDQLTFDTYYEWEHTKARLERTFALRDKLISWRGRTLHLELATDITRQVEQRDQFRIRFQRERLLMDCVKLLMQSDDFPAAVDEVLRRIGVNYQADRAYIFQIGYHEELGDVVSNTHEWCGPGVVSEMPTLQDLPAHLVQPWIDLFVDNKSVIIEDLEDSRESHPDIYAILHRQNITRLFAAPIFQGEHVLGFVGVDNPRTRESDLTLLSSLGYFFGVERSNRETVDGLRAMGLCDALTELGNRNAYREKCRQLDNAPDKPLGVIFIDLNNLKTINDTYGHEQGDAYIRGVSQILGRTFRRQDIYRVGGDEFVFLCEDLSEAMFRERASRMRADCEERYPGSLAMGVVWRERRGKLEAMVREADALMYAEKQHQKNLARRQEQSGR